MLQCLGLTSALLNHNNKKSTKENHGIITDFGQRLCKYKVFWTLTRKYIYYKNRNNKTLNISIVYLKSKQTSEQLG